MEAATFVQKWSRDEISTAPRAVLERSRADLLCLWRTLNGRPIQPTDKDCGGGQ